MSAGVCGIIGTGDGELKNPSKSEGIVSKSIAKDIVLEIIDNALEIVDDTSDVTNRNITDQIPVEEYGEKKEIKDPVHKEKPAASLIGIGDQKSNECLDAQEPIPYHPPVEKKNRLTDLVKNSKQILAKIMMSESKMALQQEKKEEEKILDVIELDCVQVSDLPFKIKNAVLPEEVPLPHNDSLDIITPPSEESMDEIGLENEEPKEMCKKIMTFPRASGSKARTAFAAKCRTLKMSANNLKKKKWDVGGKIANFFKKKRVSEGKKQPIKTSEELKQEHGFEQVEQIRKE